MMVSTHKNKAASTKRANGETGAALVEMALTVPVLFLLLSSVVEFGNILSHLMWVTQTGYNLASVAGESPRSAADALVSTRLNQLVQAEEFERFRDRIEISGVEPIEFHDGMGERTAIVRVTTNIVPIINSTLRFPITLEFTASQLLRNEQYDPNYREFGQPLPNFFNCSFSEIGGGSANTGECLAACDTGASMGAEACA